MERLEAQAQHLGAGGEHFRSAAHTKLRARRRAETAGQEAREGALARGARPQWLRGEVPAAWQAQSGGTVAGVRQDRSHYHYESTGKTARFQQIEWDSHVACDIAPATCGSTRWGGGSRIACSRGCSSSNWTTQGTAFAGGG